MKRFAAVLVSALACALPVSSPPRAASAAPDCAAIRAHVAQARAELIEADAYAAESDHAAGLAHGHRAYHELDVAARYGNPLYCYDKRHYLEYAAALVHANAYEAPRMSAEDLRTADDKIQDTLRINPAAIRKINAAAYAEMVRWAKLLHEARVIVDGGPAPATGRGGGAQTSDEDRRPRIVADALDRCRHLKESQPARAVDVPATGDSRLGLVAYYSATLEIDERARVDNVRIGRAVTATNQPVDPAALTFVLQNAYYAPATVYENGRCSAVRSTVSIESGKLTSPAK